MDKKTTNYLFAQLEYFRQEANGVECWSARDLQTVFGYSNWQNFEKVVEKAMTACKNASQDVDSHFIDINKTSEMPNGGRKFIKDYALTRYACYLIAQNGDPQKNEIAYAQTYFAIQTRKQELIEERLLEGERLSAREKLTQTEKVLSELVHQRNADFGFIRAMGDKALFGGNSTQDMKDKLQVPNGRALADYLQTPLIKGKDFAASLTNENISKKNLNTTSEIVSEHIVNNKEVRELMQRRGITPEDMPAAEDLKKVKRRIDKDIKKLPKQK